MTEINKGGEPKSREEVLSETLDRFLDFTPTTPEQVRLHRLQGLYVRAQLDIEQLVQNDGFDPEAARYLVQHIYMETANVFIEELATSGFGNNDLRDSLAGMFYDTEGNKVAVQNLDLPFFDQ